MSDPGANLLPPLRRRPLAFGAFGLILFALAVTTLHARGLVVADARYEHVADPTQFLARHAELWDDQRGPGNPTIFFSPTISLLQSIVQQIGFAPWMIGRLTLALYLSLAGCGAMVLASRLERRPSVAILTGFLYAFGPFASQLLIPSGLFLPAALMPWLFVLVVDGLRGRDPVRTGAIFALAIFGVGMLNTAALLYALAPVVLFAVLMVGIEREARWADLRRLALFCALSTALVSTTMVTVTWFSLPTVGRNLTTTELPETVARNASASESWRGLGGWLTYFGGADEGRESSRAFLTNPLVIVATYVTPMLALVGASIRSVKYRLTLAAVLVVSVVAMVGMHRPDISPLAGLIETSLDRIPSLRAFRSTYKAGAGAHLCMALLAASAVPRIVDFARSMVGPRRQLLDRAATFTVTGAIALAIAASSLPFITGTFLNERDSLEALPEHWTEVFAALDNVAPTDRVLILPGVSRAEYPWGYVNDNLFDAHLVPEAMMSQTLPQATPDLARAIEDVDQRLATDDVAPDVVGPMLGAIGADWVLVQNELENRDTELTDVDYSELADGEGLSLVGTFGRAPDGRAAIELYRVDETRPPFGFYDDPPTIVSGGPDAMATLGRFGWLDHPAVNLAELDDAELRRLVEQGASVVVTDGSRRRAVQASSSRLVKSHTLGAEPEPERPVLTMSPDVDTQSVAVFEDLVSVTATRTGAAGAMWTPDSKPSMAFDGNSDTAWTVRQLLQSASGESLTARLREPIHLDRIVIEPFVNPGGRVAALSVEATGPDGESMVVAAAVDADEPLLVDLGVTVSEITISIDAVMGSGPVGVTEVRLESGDRSLETREFIRVPTEIDRLSEETGVSVSYVFGRPVDPSEEPVMRRRFVSVHDQILTVSGRLAMSRDDARVVPIGCFELVRLDGSPIEVRAVSDRAARDVDVVGCDPHSLTAGPHEFVESGPEGWSLADLELADGRPAWGPTTALDWERQSSSEYEVSLPGRAGYLVAQTPSHRAWALDADANALDKMTADGGMLWEVDAAEPRAIRMWFGPQSIYLASIVITACSLLGCVVLVVRRRAS